MTYDLVVGLYENQGIEFHGLMAFREQSAFEFHHPVMITQNRRRSKVLGGMVGEYRGAWDHKKVLSRRKRTVWRESLQSLEFSPMRSP